MNRWRTILAIDFDRWAAETYRANGFTDEVRCASVADEIESLPYADVLLGGPPCQPFSKAGKGEGKSDKRDCIPDFLDAIRKVKPRMFLMENVDGLLTKSHARYTGAFHTEMERAGYVVEMRELDAVNYGVPQFRNRVWFWGIRVDVYAAGVWHRWPKATHTWPPPGPCMFNGSLLPGITVRQALGLDELIETGSKNRYRHTGAEARGPVVKSTDNPCFTIDGTKGPDIVLQSHADPPTSIDLPAPALRSGGGGHDGCCVRLHYDHGVATLDEPSPTLKAGGNKDLGGKQGGGCPPVIEYRWSDAMLQKHPPASPAPTVQAKWAKGGAEGLVISEKQLARMEAADKSQGRLAMRELSLQEPSSIVGARNSQLTNDCLKLRTPTHVRRLHPLECARLQSVPEDFIWPDGIGKGAIYRIVGNGWACGMAKAMSEALGGADPNSHTVIDLFCGGGLGACGWHDRAWTFSQQPDGGREA